MNFTAWIETLYFSYISTLLPSNKFNYQKILLVRTRGIIYDSDDGIYIAFCLYTTTDAISFSTKNATRDLKPQVTYSKNLEQSWMNFSEHLRQILVMQPQI